MLVRKRAHSYRGKRARPSRSLAKPNNNAARPELLRWTDHILMVLLSLCIYCLVYYSVKNLFQAFELDFQLAGARLNETGTRSCV
ncbi:hypothetical protein VTN77DRAFT_1512 [Rasamsonia byssochlamydoides]|uniref:uncharacterized protein n=1 Tax=Rasamsonia byssochlamydoides TaxID=89139 RepID=UPI0037437BDC